MSVTFEMIAEARRRIEKSIYRTFLMESASISSLAGLHVSHAPAGHRHHQQDGPTGATGHFIDSS